MEQFDVIVVGGGMVGAATGGLLAKEKLSVLVIDAFNADQFTFDPSPGLRTSAFNRFSINILKSLGAWQHVTPERRCAYTGLQTWEDEKDALMFSAADSGVDYLGHILENNLVQQALWQTFDPLNITVRSPATVKAICQHSDEAIVTLDDGSEVSARLVVGADGANSRVRQLANIGTEGWQYQQHCMAVTVKMDEAHPPTTWQQFHPTGPRAYLPLFGQYASLIWYDHADRIGQLKQLSTERLTAEIKQAFPERLGGFTLLDKGAFPLTRMHAKRYYADRTVLVGDAAHTINPLAGQGVNLGFKDAAQLAQCVVEAVNRGEELGSTDVLVKYHQRRYKANLLMMSAMDIFYLGFCNDSKPLSRLRNLALSLANKAGPLKRQVLKYAVE
ncbi:MAG: 2-octaprenyl-3-methyl-6-methoxy-1,4-benzoquinol hydroxylase [Phenylobacterium sp.]|jgi:2-octaprenyl-3-methyl-6-methoxy-1,4-benzoquinol hydroxylase